MKKVLFTICILLTCIITGVAQDENYKIEGQLDNSFNGQLVLMADTERGVIDIGDVTVTNGNFEFTGRMPEVTVAYLMTSGKKVVLTTIMLENARYTITGGSNGVIVEGGGEAQRIWQEFSELNERMIQNQESAEAEELVLLQKYSHSIVSAYVVAARMQQGIDEAKLIERYEVLHESGKATFYGKRVADELLKMQKIAIGAIAPDFSGPLADGGVLSLYETNAKVKVVNFWASWSEPCRQENVNLLTIYKRYRPKGLEIISVSIDDNKQVWLTAIGQDGSNWKNLSDLKGQASEIAAEYRVRAIPCTFILDEDNRIVAKNLYGNELEKKIAGMLKKKK